MFAVVESPKRSGPGLETAVLPSKWVIKDGWVGKPHDDNIFKGSDCGYRAKGQKGENLLKIALAGDQMLPEANFCEPFRCKIVRMYASYVHAKNEQERRMRTDFSSSSTECESYSRKSTKDVPGIKSLVEQVKLLTSEVVALRRSNTEMANNYLKFTESMEKAIGLINTKCELLAGSISTSMGGETSTAKAKVIELALSWDFKPPKTQEELNELNTKATDPKFVEETVRQFGRICDRDAFANNPAEFTAGYRLIDHIIHRDLFLLCTWYGAKGKFEFKSYKAVVDLIFELLRYGDSRWNDEKNRKFLTRIMNNSESRSNVTGERTSTARTRGGATKRMKLEDDSTTITHASESVEILVPSDSDGLLRYVVTEMSN